MAGRPKHRAVDPATGQPYLPGAHPWCKARDAARREAIERGEYIPATGPHAPSRATLARGYEAARLIVSGWRVAAVAAHLNCHRTTVHRLLARPAVREHMRYLNAQRDKAAAQAGLLRDLANLAG